MDSDNEQRSPRPRNQFLDLFDLTPEKFPWRPPIHQEIEERRAELSDRLIFDSLLSGAGISHADTYFPPVDVASLERLLDAITNSEYDELKKNSLIYWLLKWHHDGRDTTFQLEKCIPPHFVTLADAYWSVDTGRDLARAVAMLSDLRLKQEYPSKVLQALSLAENPSPLIVKYVRTAKPQLSQPDDIDIYTLALAEMNFFEAWLFQRSFPESSPTRPRLLTKILDWSLSPKPRPVPLTQLMGMPFSNYEQALVHRYALHPPPTIPPDSVPVIQDLVCIRLVQSGQYAAAIKLDRQLLSLLTKPTPKMQKAVQERKRTMDDLMAIMPAVERELIEADLERISSSKGKITRSGSSLDSLLGNDLSLSWDDMRSSVNGILPVRMPTQSFGTAPAVADLSPSARLGASASARAPNGSAPVHTPRFSIDRPQFGSAAQHLPQTSSPARAQPMPLSSSRLAHQIPLSTPSAPPNGTLPPSLFSSIGSANLSRNAFYEPPITNGVKRAFGQDAPRAAVVEVSEPPAPAPAPADVDVEPTTETETEAADQSQEQEAEQEEAPPEFQHSVFRAKPTKTRAKRAPSRAKQLPGAFVESDEEPEAEPVQEEQRSASPPPRRSRRSRTREPEPALSRSIPGGLMEEEEEEDGQDQLAPLRASPPSKRPPRKGRTTRTSSQESDGMTLRPRRRSSRLTGASQSPEPPAERAPPSKTRRKTRSSAVSEDAKSGTRKKR